MSSFGSDCNAILEGNLWSLFEAASNTFPSRIFVRHRLEEVDLCSFPFDTYPEILMFMDSSTNSVSVLDVLIACRSAHVRGYLCAGYVYGMYFKLPKSELRAFLRSAVRISLLSGNADGYSELKSVIESLEESWRGSSTAVTSDSEAGNPTARRIRMSVTSNSSQRLAPVLSALHLAAIGGDSALIALLLEESLRSLHNSAHPLRDPLSLRPISLTSDLNSAADLSLLQGNAEIAETLAAAHDRIKAAIQSTLADPGKGLNSSEERGGKGVENGSGEGVEGKATASLVDELLAIDDETDDVADVGSGNRRVELPRSFRVVEVVVDASERRMVEAVSRFSSVPDLCSALSLRILEYSNGYPVLCFYLPEDSVSASAPLSLPLRISTREVFFSLGQFEIFAATVALGPHSQRPEHHEAIRADLSYRVASLMTAWLYRVVLHLLCRRKPLSLHPPESSHTGIDSSTPATTPTPESHERSNHHFTGESLTPSPSDRSDHPPPHGHRRESLSLSPRASTGKKRRGRRPRKHHSVRLLEEQWQRCVIERPGACMTTLMSMSTFTGVGVGVGTTMALPVPMRWKEIIVVFAMRWFNSYLRSQGSRFDHLSIQLPSSTLPDSGGAHLSTALTTQPPTLQTVRTVIRDILALDASARSCTSVSASAAAATGSGTGSTGSGGGTSSGRTDCVEVIDDPQDPLYELAVPQGVLCRLK